MQETSSVTMTMKSHTEMNIKGIQHLAKEKKEQAAWGRDKAAAAHTDPRDAYESAQVAERLDAEAAKLGRQARSDAAIIQNIELLIHDLSTSTDQSAHRTLALRDLENASGRLRRELGYQPIEE